LGAGATVAAARSADDLDVALLRIRSDQCVPAPAGHPPALGDPVWVVGFPLGRPMTLASGIVSQVRTRGGDEPEMVSRLMVDAAVSSGSSGGGVYAARGGGLIGIVEGYSTARVAPQGVTPSWSIDAPIPGHTIVTPLADIQRFLAEAGQAHLMAGASAFR
jgi:S1-C subfamily serine protease